MPSGSLAGRSLCVNREGGEERVAKNTGKGYRKGEVKDRSQVKTPIGWIKRDAETGRFLDVKSDGEPFKGVRREHPEEQE
jgi:hypothetical protein